MNIKKILYPTLMFAFASALAFAGWQPVLAQSAAPVSLSGWFSAVWGDGPAGSNTESSAFLLTDDNGQTSRLVMDEALAVPLGGILALDRHRITISGIRRVASAADGGSVSIQVETVSLANQKVDATAAPLVSGSQPFITIMCKFQDVATEPKTLTYFQNMYSNVYPGLDNYWQQSSYGMANIAGSGAIGWFVLPHPRAYYFDGANWSFDRSTTDCTSAADPYINFVTYKGINMMFNDDLDGFAWGGGSYLTLDGVSKVWPTTWEPPWGYSSITALSHEMGHAFGLPHSSGTYGQTYDNQWDVMSDTWANCGLATDPVYGCLGQQTISYHRDRLGWIPAARKYTALWNTNATITLEQLTLPQTGNYLMAQIPINGSTTHFYTVEVRRKTGYDVKLPGQAVIIHEVDTTRLRPANVIDSDGNGNTGDAGAMWTVGERFLDTANAISVRVVSATATGFNVLIQTPMAFRSFGTSDGWILESGENTSVGGPIDSTAPLFRMGDDAGNRQFRSILYFDTSALPDTAVVTKVMLKIMKQGQIGTDPFTTHGSLLADIRKPYFGTSVGLEAVDFQAASSLNGAGTFGVTPSGSWYMATLGGAGNAYVNKIGTTQFRLRFTLDDNNDLDADTVLFYSGDYITVANRPQLVVQYYVP